MMTRQKALGIFFLISWFFKPGMAFGQQPVRIVHGQNSFADQRSLFYGESLMSWFRVISSNPADRIETFESPESLMRGIRETRGNLDIYLSTHGLGKGQASTLVIGKGQMKILDLISRLEERDGQYRLWIDACYNGFVLPELKNGEVFQAMQGEETEDDGLGLSEFGNKSLVAFGLPDWKESRSGKIDEKLIPGKYQRRNEVKTLSAAKAACFAQRKTLCGWKNWRAQSLRNARELCGDGEGASWLADRVGDGRAMIWLGCMEGEGGSNFGARALQTLSPELGFRCCDQ